MIIQIYNILPGEIHYWYSKRIHKSKLVHKGSQNSVFFLGGDRLKLPNPKRRRSSDSQLPTDPRDRKKEQNRRASKRFRERKKEEMNLGEKELVDLEIRNASLKQIHAQLLSAIQQLRSKLLTPTCDSPKSRLSP